MAERLANLGYFGLKVEATPGVAVIPTDYIPLYKEDVSTLLNIVEDNPIIGNLWARYQVLQGQRGHKGTFSVMAEPNTAARLFDMMLTNGGVSGAGPYTYPYTLSATAPKTYTVDISSGQYVFRFIGCSIGQMSHSYNGNEMMFDGNLSALKSFSGRALAGTPTGTNPYTLTLDTTYDPSPTTGLVVGDTMTIIKANGSTINFTVATIPGGGLTVTTTTDITSAAAGDILMIRAATPTYTLLTPFLWARTEFRFAATASAALSAAHTPLETGSQWTLMYKFENDEGAKRSGSFDPAAMVRTQGDASFKIKKFFDNAGDMAQFNALSKNACVIRHFSGTGYELRITLNNLKIKAGTKPKLASANILYSETEYAPQYDSSDGQAVDVKVLNNLVSI